MFFNTAQQVLLSSVVAILLTPLAGFLGAVFLEWSRLLLDERRIGYWLSYKVTTLSSLAVAVLIVPVQLVTHRLGVFGILADVALCVPLLALFYSRWIEEDERAIGFESALWHSAIQSALWLLVVGVFYGLSAALTSKGRVWGLGLSIASTLLLVMAATVSLSRPRSSPRHAQVMTWTTEDILALNRHANEELARGDRDDELWALATLARATDDQRREWYLAERVKKLRDLAEDQLRREGVL